MRTASICLLETDTLLTEALFNPQSTSVTGQGWRTLEPTCCVYCLQQVKGYYKTVFSLMMMIIPVSDRGTCARDKRALQQLALNVHVEHSDLT